MSGWRQVWVVLALGAVLPGCGDEPSGGLSGLVYGARDAGGNEGTPTEVAETLSERLQCGTTCLEAGVTAARCEEGVLVSCVEGVVRCEECASTGRTCDAEGEAAQCIRECEGAEIPGTELTRVCCPNTRWCEGSTQTFCNDSGTEVSRTPCAEGLDCIDGNCLPAQPLVHVIFDTSESMNWSPATNQKPAEAGNFPACDDPFAPKTRMGIAKVAFASLFSESAYDTVLFGLQRFPQKLNPYVGVFCPASQYQANSLMTEHVGLQTTGGEWFRRYHREVILEKFPRIGLSNRLVLQRWLDFDEQKESMGTPCSDDRDCGDGFCVGSTCEFFSNPEVRAPAAATPLGYSLFYAGEYFREYVVLEGKACSLDSDCDSPHHYCVDGACRDHNRNCRQRSVVLFTDGVDTVAAGDFYQPLVQAKRLRGGLDCSSDADCGRGYACDFGTCQLPSGNPCDELSTTCAEYDTSPGDIGREGNRLYDREGNPIDLTVHVIDAAGSLAASAPVAGYGRGLLIQAQISDSASLLEAIRPVFDWKDNNFCVQ